MAGVFIPLTVIGRCRTTATAAVIYPFHSSDITHHHAALLGYPKTVDDAIMFHDLCTVYKPHASLPLFFSNHASPLFCISINSVDQIVYVYADDTVIYSSRKLRTFIIKDIFASLPTYL